MTTGVRHFSFLAHLSISGQKKKRKERQMKAFKRREYLKPLKNVMLKETSENTFFSRKDYSLAGVRMSDDRL